MKTSAKNNDNSANLYIDPSGCVCSSDDWLAYDRD